MSKQSVPSSPVNWPALVILWAIAIAMVLLGR